MTFSALAFLSNFASALDSGGVIVLLPSPHGPTIHCVHPENIGNRMTGPRGIDASDGLVIALPFHVIDCRISLAGSAEPVLWPFLSGIPREPAEASIRKQKKTALTFARFQRPSVKAGNFGGCHVTEFAIVAV